MAPARGGLAGSSSSAPPPQSTTAATTLESAHHRFDAPHLSYTNHLHQHLDAAPDFHLGRTWTRRQNQILLLINCCNQFPLSYDETHFECPSTSCEMNLGVANHKSHAALTHHQRMYPPLTTPRYRTLSTIVTLALKPQESESINRSADQLAPAGCLHFLFWLWCSDTITKMSV